MDECRISVPCGAALLLLPALDICCHSRTCGCLACTLRGPYVCFVPRAVVSVDGLTQCAHTLPLVTSHAQLQVTDGLMYIDELFIKRCFASLVLSRRAHTVTTLVSRLVNGGGDGGGSHRCVGCAVSARSSAASLDSTLLCFVYHTNLCSCRANRMFHLHLTCCKHPAICGIGVKV